MTNDDDEVLFFDRWYFNLPNGESTIEVSDNTKARCPHCHKVYKYDWIVDPTNGTTTNHLICPRCKSDSLVGLTIRSMDVTSSQLRYEPQRSEYAPDL